MKEDPRVTPGFLAEANSQIMILLTEVRVGLRGELENSVWDIINNFSSSLLASVFSIVK